MYCLNVIVTSFPADDTRIDSAAALLKPFNEKNSEKMVLDESQECLYNAKQGIGGEVTMEKGLWWC